MKPGSDLPEPGKATRIVQSRYNRVAPRYDRMESFMGRLAFERWRRLLWSKVRGPAVLEVGAGTGANFSHYPEGVRVVAIDLSSGMLRQGKYKVSRDSVNVELMLMDAQHLAFKDGAFDSVVTTCVFCSVSDPMLGLAELRRVSKTGASVLMLEHVRSGNRVLGWFMDRMNGLTARMGGENINRRTVENVARSGLVLEKVTDLWAGIFKLIQATKASTSS